MIKEKMFDFKEGQQFQDIEFGDTICEITKIGKTKVRYNVLIDKGEISSFINLDSELYKDSFLERYKLYDLKKIERGQGN